MEFLAIYSPAWANAEHSILNLTIDTKEYGAIPFSAREDDIEDYGKELYRQAVAGTFGDVAEYVPPAVDYAVLAESQRQGLLTAANDKIADWKIELQLETISDDEKASLIKWMAYIKALKALDLSDVKDETGFKEVEWPDEPE